MSSPRITKVSCNACGEEFDLIDALESHECDGDAGAAEPLVADGGTRPEVIDAICAVVCEKLGPGEWGVYYAKQIARETEYSATEIGHYLGRAAGQNGRLDPIDLAGRGVDVSPWAPGEQTPRRWRIERTLQSGATVDDDRLVADGGEAVELDETFVSAPSAIHEYAPDPPELDPESMCTECGEAAHNYRCGSCARPLCRKHHELGAGFCSDFTRDEDDVPGCEIRGEFYRATHLQKDDEEIDRGEGIETDGGVSENGDARPAGGVAVSTGADAGPTIEFESDREQTEREEIFLDKTLVLVGCGKTKRDPKDPADLHVASIGPDEPMSSLPGADSGPAWPARDLYTANYFRTKAEFAEIVTAWAKGYDVDPWAVLSAEHGVVPCGRNLKYYDTKIDDLGDDPTDSEDRVPNPYGRRRPDGQPIVTEMDRWAASVAAGLCRWVAGFRGRRAAPWENDANEILILAGQDYIEPLRERGVFEYGIARMTGDPNEGYTFPLKPRYLFEEIPAGGNGEQMGWMSGVIEQLEPLVNEQAETEQQTLVTDGGERPGDGVSHADDRLQSLVFLAAVGSTTLGIESTLQIDIVTLPVVAVVGSLCGLVAVAIGSVAVAEVRR